jgi:peroxiredoxin family protein
LRGPLFRTKTQPLARKAVFFISHGGYESAWQAVSIGITAVAMGDEVTFVFAFGALRALASGTFGDPQTEEEHEEATRATGLGASSPATLLTEARSLGARVVACDTTVRVCGLNPSQVELARIVDEVLGLPQIWRLTADARVLTF